MLGKTRKGQTAMEYLMTYGWAILAVLVIGGVLYYYGVFSPQTLVGESKTGFSQVDVSQWAVSGDTMELVVSNRAGESISVTDVFVTADGETNATDVSLSLTAGETDTKIGTAVGLPNTYSSGQAYQLDVAVQFEYPDTGLAKKSSGRLSGTA